MIGQQVLHYNVLEKLGEGGMGVVYKAEDTKLKREVALKFLPTNALQGQEEKDRFTREAQAAAALNHPNIAHIYAIDEADGQMFLAMEYIEGQSLAELLNTPLSPGELKGGVFRTSGRPLPISEAIDYATQIAAGLQAAHEKGIVHHDIKSANVMVTDKGVAKIMDFGLAKLANRSKITQLGTTLGTAAYMSPEQARGEVVDHRTDIWSLGVVLYEMLTGHLPFKGDYEQAVLYSVVYEDPRPLHTHREDFPQHLVEIVRKALEKEPTARYQNMAAVIDNFRNSSIAIAEPRKTEKGIVVLPFENLSPEEDNEYFSDGLTEEIITDLSQVRSLRVISRNSAMMLKSTKKSLKQIGRELNVQYALPGGVRKAGDDLRITAQLIDCQTDAHLWAEKYRGTLEDVFEIQEKVSQSIIDSLQVRLSVGEKQKLADRPIENVHAYECYLRARQEIWRFTSEGLERATQLINTALEMTGDNELLYAAQGLVLVQSV
ncbi:serine/threonine-protein kinase, partial [bacterium]|nr:serine/threonine-protein kinase [bacterium]